MILAWLLLLTGLTISAVAIYYSVIGLAAIFAAATIPIYIMGGSLEVAKLVCASWLKANWSRAPALLKWYMTIAVIILMLITSMGIFGFLSKAHSESGLISGDVTSKIAVYDEKIKTSKENIEANRKALKQMDEAVDQSMARSTTEQGASRAVTIRQSQARERTRLQNEIAAEQKNIAKLNDEAAPVRAEVRKVEAEVGPIKYIAAFVYGNNPDANLLEKAVTWVIVIIVSVFDPLAVIMLLAAQMSFGWTKKQEENIQPEPKYEPDNGPLTEEQLDQIKTSAKVEPFYAPANSLWPFPSKTVTPEPVKTPDEEFKFLAEYKDIQQTDIQQYPVEQDYSYIEDANKQLEEEMKQAPVTVDTTEVKANEPTFQILPELEEESKKKNYMIKQDGNQIVKTKD